LGGTHGADSIETIRLQLGQVKRPGATSAPQCAQAVAVAERDRIIHLVDPDHLSL
jgi:hypothetical protein